MAEYIDRKAVIKLITSRYENPEICECEINEIPAADVAPVVRCRDCKHYREQRTKRHGNLIFRCTRMGKYDMDYPVKPDDFCSYGERKQPKS